MTGNPPVNLSTKSLSSLPRATTWKIDNSMGSSFSLGPVGASHSRLWLKHDLAPKASEIYFAGAGIGIGPLPVGFQYPRSDSVTVHTRLLRGVNTPADFPLDKLLGPACLIGGSLVLPGSVIDKWRGASITLVAFNLTPPHSIRQWLTSCLASTIPGVGFIDSCLANAWALGILVGTASGVDAGFSVVEGVFTATDVTKQFAMQYGEQVVRAKRAGFLKYR